MNFNMLKFICKNSRILITFQKSSLRKSTIYEFRFFQLNPFSSSTTQSIEKSTSSVIDNANPHQFTVNYLIHSCSLSQKQALSVSKAMTFDTPDKPDSVLASLRKHGLSNDQISSIILRYPRVLLCSPEKTLLPKIEFFQSVGFSNADIFKLIDSRMMPITRSLQSQIIPSFNFLLSIFPYNEDLLLAIVKCPDFLLRRSQSLLVANIRILRELGVPEPNILKTLRGLPKFLLSNSERLKESAQKLEKLGLDNQTMVYVKCLYGMTALNIEIWEEKLAVYKRWGCSEDEVLVAFTRHPSCMTVSAKKIMNVMGFLVDKLGYDPSDLFRAPAIFSLSVKERLVPRCSVYEFLVKKGLIIRRNTALSRLLLLPEKKFLESFVEGFENEAAELLKIYKENLKRSKLRQHEDEKIC